MTDSKISQIITDPRRQKLLLGAVSLGVIMDGLDGSIVNVALPQIAADFNTDAGTIAWVIIAYLLMMAGLLLVFGKIADRGLMKKIFISGFIIFTLSSFICGISPDLNILLAGRVIQGLGAAMIAAVAPLICVRYLPPHMLGVALAVIAASSSIGFAAGPPIGGILTQYLSWHWIFLINIPIGIIGIPFVHKVIPKDPLAGEKAPFDYAGAVTLFGAMVFGIFAIKEIAILSITDPLILVSTTLCVICLSLFVIRELTTPSPFINIRIFTKWQFSAVTVAFLLINIVFMGVIYLLPFYLSAEMNFDMAKSGMYLLIPLLVTCIISIPFGRLSDMYGRRWFVIAACLLLIVFNAIFAVILPEAGTISLIIALILMGAVFGIASGPASSRIIETAPKGEEGTGSSLMITTIYLGGVIGTALYAMIFTLATASDGVVAFADLDSATFLSGFHGTIMVGLIISMIPLFLSAIVKDEKKVYK
ncbi:MFS transporter [Methanogenium cariaci]|jgi:EmrB/QacA subfamily drug resistance transporter